MINNLKQIIYKNNLDGYIIPKNDEYFTEYSKESNLEKFAKFTGSAGFILILEKKNYLFVDGRYTLQAKKESGKNFDILEIPFSWPKDIISNKKGNLKIGFFPKIFTTNTLKRYFENTCKLVPINENIFVNEKRSLKTNKYFFKLNDKITGESYISKLKKVKKYLKSKKINYLFISSGENLCWLLNIRGRDLPNSPVGNLQGVISDDGQVYLMVNKEKIKNIKNYIINNKIKIYPEFKLLNILNLLKKKKFCIDETSCSVFNENLIKSKFKIKQSTDPIFRLKSIKNKIEINNMIEAHIKDGVALTKFLYWIKNIKNIQKYDELIIEKKLEHFRKRNKDYLYPSFSSIVGSGPNGAVIHYRSGKMTNRKLNIKDILLVDSGGQYKWGTTDITRTIAFSKPSENLKSLYTRVLKGHIAVVLSDIKTLKNGHNIDKLARSSLNSVGLNYKHGTGHGVGFFLNVHEGPQSLSKNNFVNLSPGMIVSNEPGYYLENKFGIRIENLVFIKKIKSKIKFQNLTYAPMDKDLINEKMLTKKEKDYIFNYHLETYNKISRYLNKKEKKWLAKLI